MAASVPSPVVQAVERLLERAAELGATDLHLFPAEDGVAVVARVDGVLEPVEALPAELGSRLVSRLKALANLPTLGVGAPQEGQIPEARTCVGRRLRVEAIPTLQGERVSIHLDAA